MQQPFFLIASFPLSIILRSLLLQQQLTLLYFLDSASLTDANTIHLRESVLFIPLLCSLLHHRRCRRRRENLAENSFQLTTLSWSDHQHHSIVSSHHIQAYPLILTDFSFHFNLQYHSRVICMKSEIWTNEPGPEELFQFWSWFQCQLVILK